MREIRPLADFLHAIEWLRGIRDGKWTMGGEVVCKALVVGLLADCVCSTAFYETHLHCQLTTFILDLDLIV